MPTPVSKVSICNLMLGWLGQGPITSLDDPGNTAALCKANYDMIRDAVLEEGAWQFAFKQAALPPTSTPPVYGEGNYFQLPSDLIRLLRAGDNDEADRTPWVKEGNKVRCTLSTLYIDYVYRVEDETLFTPGFVQAFAGRMAAELAMPITNSATLQQTMWKLYGQKVRSGLNLDNMQGRQRPIRSDGLIRVR